ncbi:MAG: PAS domain-containing protein [Pseudomonadota bacterium]
MQKDKFLINLSHLHINYFEKDRGLTYTGCNESTAEYAGLDSPQQIQGKTDYELIWKESSAESFRKADKEAISGKPQINHLETVEVATGLQDFLITKTNLLDEQDHVMVLWVVISVSVDLRWRRNPVILVPMNSDYI